MCHVHEKCYTVKKEMKFVTLSTKSEVDQNLYKPQNLG